MPEGIYWVRCNAGDQSAGTYFSITKLGLVTKRAGADVLAFATRLDSGDPVSGVQVGYVLNGAFVPAGNTDREGLARFRLSPNMPEKNSVVVARNADSAAFVDFYFNRNPAEQTRIYIYTDRPVYRPGDEVQFKGIMRSLAGRDYKVPNPGPVTIQVRDADENLINTQTVTSNANGTFHGRFTTNREAQPGSFRIQASYGEADGSADVAVAAYRKPNYTVKVRPEKSHYIRGERVRMIVECEYYFGGPVGGAKIQGSVFQAPKWDFYDPDDEYDYEYDGVGYGGEWFTDVEGTTDSSGKAVLEFDSRLPEEKKESWMDSQFTLVASVADDAGAYFEGRGSVTVSAGEFSLVADQSHYLVEKGQPFEVTFETKDAESGKARPGQRIRAVAGYQFWDGLSTNFTPFAEKTVTTGSDGKSIVVVTPAKSGEVVVRAYAEDSQGNEIRSECSVYSSGRGDSEESYHYESPLTIRLDKKQYDRGETAKLLILAEKPGATALVTIEGDRIYKVQTVKLEGNSTTVSIPVLDAYAPNVFASVCYVKDKQFESRQKRILVDLGRRELAVTVHSDKEKYLPGETATYSIETKDEAGHGVPAEVSLSVVDESIYAIREDDTDLARAFYPRRYNEVQTSYSFTTLYLDGGDKAPPAMEIRRNFKDTAFWQPTVQTDGQGKAQVTVPLPDNLTTWRATVQAISSSTAVGEAVSKAVARKPLMVRLQTPAFYIAGDTQRLAASLTNASGQAAMVNCELTLTGATAKEAARQSIRLADGETKTLEWNVTVGDPGEAGYVARAWIDNATTDGVEAKVPIRARGRTTKDAFTGDVATSTMLRINVDPNADRTSGGIVLSLSPSLAAPLFQSLDDLIGFPYGCVEQTMSRFMPTMVVSKVVQELGLPRPRQAGQIPAIAAESLSRLGKLQSYEGGWGWWEYDKADTFMTAYVLEGLYRARSAGQEITRVNLENALKWGEARLKSELPDEKAEWWYRTERDERAFLAYALALHGRKASAAAYFDALDLAKLGSQGTAFLVLGYSVLGPEHQAQRDAAYAHLKSLATTTGNVVSWKEDYWGVETTARALQALVAVDPSSPLISGAIRYLMLSRRGDFWFSTRDTAIALLAISDYMKAANLQFGPSSIGVWVNGKPLGVVSVTTESIAEAAKRIEIPMRLLTRGENQIEIRRTGQGACYYSAELVQTIVENEPQPFSNLTGVKLNRTYHRLVQERRQDGRMDLVPSREAVTRFQPGELIRVVLEVTSDRNLRFVQVEDPIPSNCRVVEREDLDYGQDWGFWWDQIVVRDDRVSYFARHVSKSKTSFTLEYTMRAEQAGTSAALPASICEMYDPALRAWTGIRRLEVRK